MTSVNSGANSDSLAAFKAAVSTANNSTVSTRSRPRRGPVDYGKTTAQAYIQGANFQAQQEMGRMNRLNSADPKFITDIRQPSQFHAMQLIIPEQTDGHPPVQLAPQRQMFEQPTL